MRTLLILSVIGLSGCSTIVEGSSQRIFIDTRPDGAECVLERNGETIATVKTPVNALVEKSKYDINIYCNKKGYKEAHYRNHSGIEDATLGNLILGGGIGWAIDSATGSDNKYEPSVIITMEKR